MFFRFCCYIAVLSLFTACGNPSGAASQAENTRDSIPPVTTGADPLFRMKDIMINAEYVFPDGENVRGTKMDAAAISKFKPDRIDEFFAMGDSYFVLDTIAQSNAGSIYCVLKYDPNETTGWLVIYDPQMNVADQLEVYYENAEGNFMLHSSILDNIVTCAGENITPEREPVSAFRIVEGPKWQVIEH
jgi:hypothetical protein